ncbi:DeoR/GlpR family DNA-binding transcription regulator [Orenia marismortui]|uniref:DeoR family transcriptional regulator n=1 Tax=Orenia marismortui TaxID=46469 RepID=A0A4R8GIZ6_9FIRM|nr:DeoR/GlpR family DNA-binding transcription regulator [Orenia marismortui]TDX45305.1 DeoR family transcriptional regulator [Orenia marismortui]
MFAEERRDKIFELIKDGKAVAVNELCDIFNVSSSTIRRDLQQLEDSGLINRTHGGAVVAEGRKFEPSFIEKEKEHPNAKKKIAKQALELIEDGDTIILDAGTTTTELARLLEELSDLTIVTNATNIALELSTSKHQIILTGGILKKKTLAMVGPIAELNLRNLNPDKVFLGANGITLSDGLTTPDLVEANTKKAMLERAKEVIILADHSKFGETAFVKIAEIKDIDTIITDRDLNRETLKKFKENVEIILA